MGAATATVARTAMMKLKACIFEVYVCVFGKFKKGVNGELLIFLMNRRDLLDMSTCVMIKPSIRADGLSIPFYIFALWWVCFSRGGDRI